MTLHCGGVAREEAFKSSKAREKDEEEEEGEKERSDNRATVSEFKAKTSSNASFSCFGPSGFRAAGNTNVPQSPEMSS